MPTSVRILIADDHEVVRRGLRSLLEGQEGWEVIGEAATGREAVNLAKELKPDVVVLDVSMPELNGLDATRQILRDAPGVEVLMLTVHSSEDLIREVLQAGARGYILKSDAAQDLVAAVTSLSQHKPYLTGGVAELVLQDYLGGSRREGEEPGASRLTVREREIVQLVAEGKTNKEIAAALGISIKTVETHRTNIMSKLNLRTVSDLVRYAVRNNLVQA